MPNSFYTPTQVAQEMVRLLENELIIAKMVSSDLSSEFSMKGSTIYVRRQMQYLGQDDNLNLSSYSEDVIEGTVPVAMDKPGRTRSRLAQPTARCLLTAGRTKWSSRWPAGLRRRSRHL